jgi:UDP-N-acetylglucosamine--N-acetylmuramyl-(pentapeptide) pyrophosphoryl-undecaprenol N-acetylglucosamine transferase
LRNTTLAAGVQAKLTPFIDDTAKAFADGDLVILPRQCQYRDRDR